MSRPRDSVGAASARHPRESQAGTGIRAWAARLQIGPLVLGCVALYLSSLYSYLLFHSLVEIVTIAIAFMLFVLVWNTQRFYSNGFLCILGIGYGSIALIDLLHTLSFPGMKVFAGFVALNLAPQLWLAARFLQAFTILAALLFVNRRTDNRVVVGIYAVLVPAVTAFVFSGHFPTAYIDGRLTPFKVNSEYAITALLLVSLYLFYRQRARFDVTVFRLVAASILCTVFSEVSFTAYVSMVDSANLIGHLFKLTAFYLVYRAILVTGLQEPYDLIFRDLTQTRDELQEARDTLEEQVQERTAELRASEQKYRVLIESANDAVFIHEMLPNGSPGPFIEVNDVACEMLGYTREELAELGPEQIDDPRYRGRIAKVMERLQYEGQAVFETAQIAKDGHSIPVEVSTRVVEIEGKRLIFSLVRDITERRQTEEYRIAKQAAEAASVAKSAFLANMSHEIRTPMNAILGFSQLMSRDTGLTEHQRQQLDIINSSGEHLLALINDVLQMSKIEAGRVSANVAALDLHALTDEIESMFGLRAEGKGLALKVTRAPDVPRFVVTDENKLRQILVNLLGNAVKFTSEGSVELRVDVYRNSEGRLRLVAEVQDTGPGIAAHDTDKLFDYFEQAGSQEDSEAGTGLGLAISREFVRLLGGGISVESEPGVGSIFRFEIDLEEPSVDTVVWSAEGHRVLGLQPGQPICRALVVDDVPGNRELVVQILEEVGFEVRSASNGREAVAEFGEWHPQVILMDLRMPVMDGYEATRRIRASAGGADVAILAVTASAFAELREGTYSVGIDDFVVKPFHAKELLDKIAEFVGVQYVYEENVPGEKPVGTDTLDRAALEHVPEDLRLRIREAVLAADFAAAGELADEVSLHDEHAAAVLRTLAARFDADGMLSALSGVEDL